MQMEYCQTCGRKMGFKRLLGVGTILMVLLTLGLWILFIPFYPSRCISCGETLYSTRVSKYESSTQSTTKALLMNNKAMLIFILVALTVILVGLLFDRY